MFDIIQQNIRKNYAIIWNIRVVVILFLNIIIFFNKRKLEKLIKLHNNYDDILAQSQKLDKLINKKFLKK